MRKARKTEPAGHSDHELQGARLLLQRVDDLPLARANASYEPNQISSIKLQHELGIWHRPRYRHIVVDEAQDLSAAHWKMLRAMVPEGSDDLFIAGDTHQRIYGNHVSLGSLGINIRGRSSKLTLSYRTTQEIFGAAVRLLGEEEWDDLDDRRDNLTGYRSVLRGMRPSLVPYATWDAELDGLVKQVLAWSDVAKSSIAICVPERHMVAEVENRLGRAGIGPEGPRCTTRSTWGRCTGSRAWNTNE